MENLGNYVVPLIGLLIVVAFVALGKTVSNNYIKVPPNKAAIFYGREYVGAGGQKVWFKVITGGSRLKYPMVESVQYLNLATFSISLQVDNVPNKDGVLVNARGVALVKILSEETSLMSAVERFLGKTENDVRDTAHQNLEGHLRSIVGRLTVEELVSDRAKFNQEVLSEAAADLQKIGLGIDMLTIQHIDDQQGYIIALGQKRTAEVQRDARVGKAQAESEAKIAESEAEKQAAMVAAQNAVMVAEAQKDRDLKVAQFRALTDRETAIANQSGAIAQAEADKTVRQKKVEAEAAETTARIQLADQETLRVEKELQFKVLKPAEAKRQAAVIEAEGVKSAAIIKANQEKEAAVIKANADNDAAVLSAEATRTTATAEAEATRQKGQGQADALKAERLAHAVGIEAEKKAEAAGQEAMMLAQARGVREQKLADAAGTEATLMAQARGAEANLLAEARGKKELALALASLDQTGKLLQVLDAAPKVAEALGEALAKALGPEGLANVFGQMAAPLGSVDSIRMYDFGGNGHNGNGGGALAKYANLTPELFFQFISKANALGFGKILEKLGLTSDILEGVLTPSPKEDGEVVKT